MLKTSYLTVKLGPLFRTDFINILLVGMAQQYEGQKSPGVVGLEVPWEKFHIEHQIRLVRIQLNDGRDVKHSHRSQVVREVRCCFQTVISFIFHGKSIQKEGPKGVFFSHTGWTIIDQVQWEVCHLWSLQGACQNTKERDPFVELWLWRQQGQGWSSRNRCY